MREDQPPLMNGEALRPARCLVFKQLSPKNAEKTRHLPRRTAVALRLHVPRAGLFRRKLHAS
ncbi:hypothetical protein NK6_9296 [Bradyrhizobium diazoefficiens]|uniref:Uncharacterized protein n=1 Tax=Bradyrhizobium diazoefficiens TaxID=1355477 RepID=A0A0E3VXC8_9BRAD|nr:hypothetical protein NK6_9296 [Bradyrhizobium diazoefficiens]